MGRRDDLLVPLMERIRRQPELVRVAGDRARACLCAGDIEGAEKWLGHMNRLKEMFHARG